MRRDTEQPASIRLTAARPSDLVGLVPYLLGFRPSESVVVVHLRAGRVALTSRVDLDPGADPEAYATSIRSLAWRHGIDGLAVLVYTEDPSGHTFAVALAERLEGDGLVDALLVDPQRWWSATCDGSCCPSDGTPYDLTSHPLSAEAVLAGMSSLPDRSTMFAWVRGPEPAEVPAAERELERARLRVAGLTRARRSRLMARLVADRLGERAVPDDDCLLLAVLTEDLHVRDVAWAAITRRRAQAHVDLWRQVVGRAPVSVAAGPVCILGMAGWVSGNGTLQNLCVDRMAEVDPGYTMTGILVDINERALAPAIWDDLAKDLRRALKRAL